MKNKIALWVFYLWVQIKKWNLQFPWIKWAALVAFVLIVSTLIFVRPVAAHYYYIDLNGNRGIANNCWESKGQLLCDRVYGGKIAVVQYWKW